MGFKVLAGIILPVFIVMGCAQHPEAETAKREPSSKKSLWNQWYKYGDRFLGQVAGLALLSGIRKDLLKKSLHDPHIDYKGYGEEDCTGRYPLHRSDNGTCYNPDKPYIGAAGVAFGRNVRPDLIVSNEDREKYLQIPDPAEVSREFFTREVNEKNEIQMAEVPFLNMIAASWIQFMNHDWLTHGRNDRDSIHKVEKANAATSEVEATKENKTDPKHYKPKFGRTTLNEVTHWWDASQVYGSSHRQQKKLRTWKNGKMKVAKYKGRDLLPYTDKLRPERNPQNQGNALTGFNDNWWVGLSMLHTLFLKEHNAIADMLMKEYVAKDQITDGSKKLWVFKAHGPQGTQLRNSKPNKKYRYYDDYQLDQHIFQLARMINAAVLAKIHTVEWTPAILNSCTLKRAMYVNWYGAGNLATWSTKIKNCDRIRDGAPGKANPLENLNFGHTIGGIVGDKYDTHGQPYSITEEFTSVYRLHSLLPETLNFKTLTKNLTVKNAQQIPFADTRNEKSYPLMKTHPLRDLFYSFGTQLPGQLIPNNFPKFMQTLDIPGRGKMDLGMVDIMRDRERGVPRYNQFRLGIGLEPINEYRDFFPPNKDLTAKQSALIEKFKKVYGVDAEGNDNVDMIDLLVGTLSEDIRPPSFGFGETMFHLFILMASRRLMADPYYTTYFKSRVYTPKGIEWISKEGFLDRVIIRHMPELAPKLKGLDTAFKPWNP